MNNTDINAILEAAGELDNEVLENAFKKRKKRPIALIVAAAAAAALSVLAGFAVAYKNNVLVNGEPVFDYNITIHDEVTSPSAEELTEMGASILYQEESLYEYVIEDIDPRDLIQKYNITTLGNNRNFSRADNKGYSASDRDADEYRRLFLSRTRVAVADDYHVDGMYGSYVRFIYWLSDDSFNMPVNFRVMCLTGNYNASMAQEFASVKPDGSDIAYIDLNNNEKAVIHQTNYDDGEISSSATFTYDGMIYYIHADTDIEGMKQILTDLGIVS